jgi:copper(I)-binding protein
MRLTYWALALVPALIAAAPVSQVTIENPVINKTFATATITVPTNDRLEGLSAPGGIAMLHTITRKGMKLTTYIPFKANTPRRLTKYGYHIMLMRKPTTPTLPMILIFEKAGAVSVTFKVVG